ncbi:MAG TPA: YdeI/OmpD-associated family protein [Gemmatimonadales bacterium]|nr:YdeI/OmpD-associated family protein [Gemmatimonadales bacterium]
MTDHQPRFFSNAAEFSRWLATNHASARELWLGVYKKTTGKQTITYLEALDEALCYGWIDSIQRGLDPQSYAIRFTPRKPGSLWSAYNQKRVAILKKDKRMQAPGLKAFRARDAKASAQKTYERANCEFGAALEKRFRKSRKAWDFFQAQPPGYRRITTWWVVSAKLEATQLRRLATLMKDSGAGRRIAQMTKKP